MSKPRDNLTELALRKRCEGLAARLAEVERERDEALDRVAEASEGETQAAMKRLAAEARCRVLAAALREAREYVGAAATKEVIRTHSREAKALACAMMIDRLLSAPEAGPAANPCACCDAPATRRRSDGFTVCACHDFPGAPEAGEPSEGV